MTRKVKWQIGDHVRLREPKKFVRCGYPMYLPDVAADLIENHKDRLNATLVAAGLHKTENSGVLGRLADALAYAEINQKGFGGRTRAIYEADLGEDCVILGSVPVGERLYRIADKFYVMTGEYYGPSSGYNYYGEYDYSPGGLNKAKSNTILVLDHTWPGQVINESHTRIDRRTAMDLYTCVWDIRVERVSVGVPQ